MISSATVAAILALSNFYTSAEAFSLSPPCTGPSSRTLSSPPHQTHLSATSETIVIGGGRIGSLLSDGARVVGRDDPLASAIDADGAGPIFVATRNDVLEGIVDGCPARRRRDLVFVQNGYLDAFLARKGLASNTQALLYLSVTARGAAPVDGITAVNPEGLTAATGPHAAALAARLAALGLRCRAVSAEAYRPAMFEKLIWIATYMLVGTARDCRSVGEAGAAHAPLVRDVVAELAAAVAAREGVAFAPGTAARLAAYTDVVQNFPCGVKEFAWRNRYFYDLGDAACPLHNGLLRECAAGGKLGFELP